MRLRRFGLCLLSILAGLMLTTGLFALVQVASAAPTTAPVSDRSYPSAAPCATTLQACINGSNAGDVIHIAAGVFTQSFTLGKAVSLVGAGADLTWLHAQPNNRVITITNEITASILISGMTIAGGSVPNAATQYAGGGGVTIGVGNQVIFNRVVFRENVAGNFGGGLRSISPVTIVNSLFLSNTAGLGGGLDASLTSATITGTDFIGNVALWGGGGAYIAAGSVSGSRFERNSAASREGGGLSVLDGAVSNTQFFTNSAVTGGGLMVYRTAAIQGVVLRGNEAQDLGGGAYIAGGAVFTGVTVVDNRAGDGGGVFFSNISRQAVITGSLFSGNVATTTAGTGGVVFGYVRAATQTVDSLVNTNLTGAGTPASRAVQAGLGPGLGLTGTTITSHTAGVVALGAATPISSSFGIESWPADCPVVVTYTRPVTIWYGSTYADGAPVLEVASASVLFSSGAWTAAEAAGRPERVLRGLYPWVDPVLTNIEGLLGSYATFDAEANLRTALAAAWRPAPYNGVRFDPPIDRGTDEIVLDSFIAQTDCHGSPVDTNYMFQFRMIYVELNAFAVELRPLFLPLLRR